MASPSRLRTIDNRLHGRLALVTGSSGGIGSACARALAADGCDVVLHFSSNKDRAQNLADELSKEYPSQLFVTAAVDLSDREATRCFVPSLLRMPAVAAKHKSISVLVANAGLGRRIRDVQHIKELDWDEMMEINARSTFVITKACLEGMRAQAWGRVILVASIASRGGGLNGCHYAASKGAIVSMGLNLATLLAEEGITVNVVSPAMIGATGMMPDPKSTSWTPDAGDKNLEEEDLGLAVARTIPVRRLGSPQEVAHVVSMFANTGYMTGQEIVLAGGLK